MEEIKDKLFQEFYSEHGRYIKNIIRKRYPTVSLEEREDLEQESLINIYRHIESFGNRSSIKTWATAVVCNYCKNHFRSKFSLKRDINKNTPLEIIIQTKYRPKSDNISFCSFMEDKKSINALDGIIKEEASNFLHSSMLYMEKKYSDSIIEVFIKQKSYSEAASSLGITISTLRSRLCYAKKSLKKIMKKKILQKRKGTDCPRLPRASD